MKKAHLDLIQYALKNGKTVSVWDGGEWVVVKGIAKVRKDGKVAKLPANYKLIKGAIESVDISEITIHEPDTGENIGWAYIVLDCDQDPDEIIADYSCTDYFMNSWAAQYYK